VSEICPPHLPLYLWKSKKSFFKIVIHILQIIYTLPQKKTNSNCCTAALAVYVLLFGVFYYLHSPSTVSGARYRRSACIDTEMLRLAAAACCDMGWISAQRGVPCDWMSKKTVEACINAERGHSGSPRIWYEDTCLPFVFLLTVDIYHKSRPALA